MVDTTNESRGQETRKRLMDAAEDLFATHGIAGTSLREITDQAGVNMALVKYHFGSKNGLVEETLKRRLEPINAARLLLLGRVEEEYLGMALPLEKVLNALIRPAVEAGLNPKENGPLFLRLFGRIFSEPAEAMNLIRKQMGPMIVRFDAAFERALPDLPAADMGWRKMASFGVVQHSLLMLSMMNELPLLLRIPLKILNKSSRSPDVVTAQLVSFCAAGMRATVEKP
jgi:AcrR family transcriptional regulator